ncbi:thioredoxin domain-containing protein [Ruegeria pomeroyi]|uniref:Thioredoxin domain-containing protein n=2 Tax=Ruegeria TaxID=97050 RepID=A0A9Q3WBX5_9RHOB|nr:MULTISPECIES: DsbA family protein [Ruegeria]MCE8510577.1 thioredoxin domain-containing protein [Ruegeria pomeroyi]MCE8511065.1 thioredoxin domain-containing protein [Ruegeria pomeroyi]MCE8518689.1 thioredoxin domain-containing protein [Ruegeria pomeroyi]MCE8519477.1 thioredoxin domain-containing protein [Ruegeria pomeroyi]MCE8524390.1 thioredoxin domain-containing protein [Ruegeria pomeroyi]
MMLRHIAPAVTALSLLSVPAQALDLSDMTPDQRAAFGEQVRAYLLENPEVIIEAVNLLEQRKAQEEAQQDLHLVQVNAEELFNDGYSWVGGNPEGDITLVEFMDYRCGYCRRAVPEVAELLQSDGNIRLIIKEFPILGEASLASSRFAVATLIVAGPDAYKQVHDALLDFTGEADAVALRRIGEGLGLDTDAILAEMESEEVTRRLAETRALAQRLNISGTPSFVMETEMLRGYLPADQMQQVADALRAERS